VLTHPGVNAPGDYIESTMISVKAKNPAEPELHQAVAEVFDSLRLVLGKVPVVVLGYDYREIKNFVARNPVTDPLSGLDRVFLWQGNARILIAIVKYVEDKRNVLHDTRAMGVPVLLVVEDNIRYYSSFLPVIYTELIKQSRRVIQEGINESRRDFQARRMYIVAPASCRLSRGRLALVARVRATISRPPAAESLTSLSDHVDLKAQFQILPRSIRRVDGGFQFESKG
jgi:hypothetical protein